MTRYYAAATAAPAGGQAGRRRSTAIEYLEVARPDEPRRGAAPADALRPPAASRCRRRSTPRRRRDRRRRAHPRRSGSSGPTPADALPAGGARRAARRARRARPRAGRAHRRARRLLALPLRARRRPGSDDAAGGLRPAARRGRRSRSRSSARATSTARRRAPARRASTTRRRSTTSPRTTRASAGIMLERMALLAPEWTERSARRRRRRRSSSCWRTSPTSSRTGRTRSPPRPTCDTARSRVSLRRHARLVDYRVHDGCNARAWVQVSLDEATPSVVLPAGDPAADAGARPARRGSSRAPRDERGRAAPRGPIVFETVEDAVLHGDLDALRFWTWGDAGLLPAAPGATVGDAARRPPGAARRATCSSSPRPSSPRRPATPRTPTRAERCAVRLVDVAAVDRPVRRAVPDGGDRPTSPRSAGTRTTRCRSRSASRVDGVETAEAWGNIVLADHGATRRRTSSSARCPTRTSSGSRGRDLRRPMPAPMPRAVPAGARAAARSPARSRGRATVLLEVPLDPGADRRARQPAGPATSSRRCSRRSTSVVPDRSADPGRRRHAVVGERRRSPRGLLRDTGRARCRCSRQPAPPSTRSSPTRARPGRRSRCAGTRAEGTSRVDAAARPARAAPATQREFVVEIEHDGTALAPLRRRRARPPRRSPGTDVRRDYRVGNGGRRQRRPRDASPTSSPATAEVARRVRTRCRRPAASTPRRPTRSGATRPASLAVQERAVTTADYAPMARAHARGRSAPPRRSAGPARGTPCSSPRTGVGGRAGRRARSRTGLRARPRALPDGRLRPRGRRAACSCRSRSGCTSASSPATSARTSRPPCATCSRTAPLADGRLGLFHPDRLHVRPAGLPLAICSPRLHAVAGVESVDVGRFQRQHEPETSGIDDGVLPMGRLEIARLDNDPNFPERGVLDLSYGGGT